MNQKYSPKQKVTEFLKEDKSVIKQKLPTF